ncbi:McrB family protein [Corallococcus macrosporus]|uniref:McrB family protein n=1 Tax=Corallococcus macrosporus TaxID=35 RepID=UPI0012FD593B|nr:AAA family ATPase [Corallococcus macrosporus]
MASSDPDALGRLSDRIRVGLAGTDRSSVRPLLEGLFGGRFAQRHTEKTMFRDAYSLGEGSGDGVPYAGLIHPENPQSGPYGGTSLVWFPTTEAGSLIGLVVGTRGLSPDEGILMRPGHRRRIAALRRYLAQRRVEVWTKPDPAALGVLVPKTVRERFAGFDGTFQRYGREMYCTAVVPSDPAKARWVVQAFLDLYAHERGWQVLKPYEAEYDRLHGELRSDLFPSVDAEVVHRLLQSRHFVILQGPPGTGKTRLAEEIRERFFGGQGMTVQFHPAVTYEDFVVGLTPDARAGSLRFAVRSGWLLEAARAARERPFLLTIDELNRADLGKVLGEAIYLFEPGEIGSERPRSIRLPHQAEGMSTLDLPANLFVLATMNTADRSIAPLDLAIRRRFAFVHVPPDREVVVAQGLGLATEVFDRLTDIFVEHAPPEALELLPGHAYFIAKDTADLLSRFRFELLPLLDEYLRQGFLGPASSELSAVRDSIEDAVHQFEHAASTK